MTIAQKRQIIAKSVECPSLTHAELAKWAAIAFKLPHKPALPTISAIISNAARITSDAYGDGHRRKPLEVLSLRMEHRLAQWIEEYEDENLYLSRQLITMGNLDGDLCDAWDLNLYDGWLIRLTRRHGLRSRQLHGEAASADPKAVHQELQSLQELTERYVPADRARIRALLAPSTPRVESLKLRVNSYARREGERLVRWLVEVDTAITARRIVDPLSKVAFAMSCLSGRARGWAYGHRLTDPTCFSTFEVFKEELRQAFEPPQNEFRSRDELLDLQQGKHDVHAYAQRARYLVSNIVTNPIDEATNKRSSRSWRGFKMGLLARLDFEEVKLPRSLLEVSLATDVVVRTEKRVVRVRFSYEEKKFVDEIIVLDLDDKFDVELGMLWLARRDPVIDRAKRTVVRFRITEGSELGVSAPGADAIGPNIKGCSAVRRRGKRGASAPGADAASSADGCKRPTPEMLACSRAAGMHDEAVHNQAGLDPCSVPRPWSTTRSLSARGISAHTSTTCWKTTASTLPTIGPSSKSSSWFRRQAPVPGGDPCRDDDRALARRVAALVGGQATSRYTARSRRVCKNITSTRSGQTWLHSLEHCDRRENIACRLSKRKSRSGTEMLQAVSAGQTQQLETTVETLSVLACTDTGLQYRKMALVSPPTLASELTSLPAMSWKRFARDLHDGRIEQICILSDVGRMKSEVEELKQLVTEDADALSAKSKKERFDEQSWDSFKSIPLYEVLREYKDVPPDDIPAELPQDKGVQHEIDLVPGTKYCVTRQWPLPREQVKAIDDFFESRRKAGQVRESKIPHSAPTFCVKKAQGGWRIVHAYNKLNDVTKCIFGASEIPVLGCLVGKNGVRPDPGKARVINEWHTPLNVKELRQFLGLATYLCKYLSNYAGKIRPLSQLLKKDAAWDWTAECQQAFDAVKQGLTEAPILAVADQDRPFHVVCDASDFAIGYALMCGVVPHGNVVTVH
ncbi:unnamed protein product [Phytophthora fragariaefolia]|uniref:Unnamed protein product n=1 Tax=Phytophthora fragariaefolia TaxID=1490495 RepID=A0A9W7CQ74_9STRA|nr:unnamed protein product [Phytophthora fragariaefolia]